LGCRALSDLGGAFFCDCTQLKQISHPLPFHKGAQPLAQGAQHRLLFGKINTSPSAHKYLLQSDWGSPEFAQSIARAGTPPDPRDLPGPKLQKAAAFYLQ